jgi:hypothetical protein
MAVMPLVAQEPWKYAEQEANTNNALYELFLKQKQQSEEFALSRQQQDKMAGLQQSGAMERQLSQQNFSQGQQERNFDFQRERRGDDGADPLANYRAQFREIEKAKGLPEGTLDAFAEIESGSGRNLRAKSSSAKGPFQFVDSTAKRFNLKDPMDPIASAIATAEYAAQNRELFKQQFGREPTGRDLYLMHQQGEGGGPKLLRNPNAKAVDVVGLQAVLNNGGNINMSAGQFAEIIQRKYDNADTMWRGKRGTAPATQTADAGTTPAPAQSGQQQPAPATTTPTAKPKLQRVIGPDGKLTYKEVTNG